jgi:hypothetical protein
MTNSTPPNQRRREEELVAVIVALLAFSAIAFGALRGRANLNFATSWSNLLAGVGLTPTPSVTQAPPVVRSTPNEEVTPTPAPTEASEDPTIQAAPSPAPRTSPDARVGVVPLVVPTQAPVASPSPSSSAAVTEEPAPAPTIAGSPIDFRDVPENYWARPYINRLSAAGIITGFPDETFRPNRAVTRAEFASQIERAFQQPETQPAKNFKDVPADYWAAPAINKSVSIDFLNGYPEGDFRPNKLVPRLEVLIALAEGLNVATPANPEEILQVYQDNAQIPKWARAKIAAATQAGLVTSYPNRRLLNPAEAATRADVSSMIYQALVFNQKAEPLEATKQFAP